MLTVPPQDKSGELDIDEWEEAIHRGLAKRLEQLAEERERRERAARAEDEAFTAERVAAPASTRVEGQPAALSARLCT